MKREANRSMPLLLYGLAAPVYFVRGVLTLLRLFRLWRISRLGYVDCPHCGAQNAIDILAYCPKCRTSEYGNRLRCTGTLMERFQPRPGAIGMPRFPSIRFPDTAQIDVDSAGQVKQANGGTQLPFLLGEMGQFLLDPLPADNRPTWEYNGTCTLESGGGNPTPGSPPGRTGT